MLLAPRRDRSSRRRTGRRLRASVAAAVADTAHGLDDFAGLAELFAHRAHVHVDVALEDDLLARDAAGLATAVEEVDVAELPQRIGELAAMWIAKALAAVDEDDRPAAAERLAPT